MASRTYALTLGFAGVFLFLAVVCANVMLDPQAVFRAGVPPHTANTNDRFQRFRDYQASPDRFDGLVFGSSRAAHVPLDELSRRSSGVNFSNFGVTAGLITDHLPVLEYVLQHQARNIRLRAVFLLLDIDYFGTQPVTNKTVATILPPALTGESSVLSWWRQLTTIQFKAWRAAIRRTWITPRAAADPTESPDLRDVVSRLLYAIGPSDANAQTPSQPAPRSDSAPLERITDRVDFNRQLTLLKQFVDLCRGNDIALVVAISPLPPRSERRLDPGDLDRAIDRIDEIVPVWDFSRAADWPSDQADFWIDANHFSEKVALMMLRRISADDMPAGWTEFGRYRSRSMHIPAKAEHIGSPG